MLPNYLVKNEIARPNNIINMYTMGYLTGLSTLVGQSPTILNTATAQDIATASPELLATASIAQLKGIRNTAIAGLTVAQSKAIATANPPVNGGFVLDPTSLANQLYPIALMAGPRTVSKTSGGTVSIPVNASPAALGPGVAITQIGVAVTATSIQQLSPAMVKTDIARAPQQVEAAKANINTITYQIDLTDATGADAALPSIISMNIETVNSETDKVSVSYSDDNGNTASLGAINSNGNLFPDGTIISAGVEGTTVFLNIIDGSGDPVSLEGEVTISAFAFEGAASIILTDVNSGATSTLMALTSSTFRGFMTVNSTYTISSGGSGSGVVCFATGARILTKNGYKAVETLTPEDRLVTSDGRSTCFKLLSMTIDVTTSETAPYRIEAHAFGRNIPAAPVFLSPIHMMQIRKGVWTCPKVAVRENTNVKQYGVGESVTYYHVRCGSYLRDNLVTEGMTVESLGTKKELNGAMSAYTWNPRLKGFTRMTPSSITKHSH
jgi:hypothetical protein